MLLCGSSSGAGAAIHKCLPCVSGLLQSSLPFTTTQPALKKVAGKHKGTRLRTKPITYEQYVRPEFVGVKKAWLSWHTSNLQDFGLNKAQRACEDEIIRRLVRGIWPQLFVNELVIKRRGNLIAVAGFVEQRMTIRKMYWMLGFSEELLSLILKQPVKFEIQSVAQKEDVIFKYI